MDCFRCRSHFTLWKSYADHLKPRHGLDPSNSDYLCTFPSCGPTKAWYFGRHFQQHVNDAIVCLIWHGRCFWELNRKWLVVHYSSDSPRSVSDKSSSAFKFASRTSSVSNDFPMDNSFASDSRSSDSDDNSFKDPGNFFVHLHSFTNFTRKNVEELQKSTLEVLLLPLLSAFEKWTVKKYARTCEDRFALRNF